MAALVGAGALAAAAGDLRAHRRISTAFGWDEIGPILAQRCATCHDGTSIPLRDYAAARPWVVAMREEVLARRLPVARATTGPHAAWPPLTPLEVERLLDWIDGGAPERRPSTAAAGEYWCPMHADVRAPLPASCPQCGMALVAFAPDFTRRFEWTVRRVSARRWQVRLLDVDRGPVSALVTTHERPFHLFAVRDDLDAFAHLHPLPVRPGTLEVDWEPTPGRYRLFAEAFPEGAAPHLLVTDVTVPGARPGPAGPSVSPAASGLRVDMQRVAGTRAGQVHTLAFTLTNADGAPASGLRPYLGADAHVFAAHESRDDALHGHPEVGVPGTGLAQGRLEVDLLLARAGRYRIWLQVQQGEHVHTYAFDHTVAPGPDDSRPE